MYYCSYCTKIFLYLVLQCFLTNSYARQSCTDPQTKTVGCCRPLNECPSAVQDPKRHKRQSVCRHEKNKIMVCCRGSCTNKRTTEAPYIWGIYERPSLPYTEDRISGNRISEKKCREYIDMKLNLDLNFHRIRRAIRKSKNIPKIGTGHSFVPAVVGGRNSRLSEFPHMAALGWYYHNRSVVFKCGGSLISDKFVVTAAHCTRTPQGSELLQSEPSVVRLGDQNIQNGIYDGAQPVDITIKRIIKHPQYKPPKKYFDIALIELKNKVSFTSRIVPACLWTKNDFGNHKTAIVTGWGTTVYGGTQNSHILQKADLDIINSLTCDNLLSSTQNRNWRGLQSHQMCAGVLQGGIDACQGDSGGPLQVRMHDMLHNYYAIIGVTSFGKQCAKANQPGVYTKISYFVDWIESIVWP